MYLKIDASQVADFAQRLGASVDQLPFAMSVALNRAASDTYKYLTDKTWPTSVNVRNPSFIRAALRTEFSTKRDLSISIYDRLNRASLQLHAVGGTKRPKGSNLAVPSKNVVIGAHGSRKSQRPRNLAKSFVKGGKIYQKVGTKKNPKLRVMYFLKPSVNINKDVLFYEDFKSQMYSKVQSNLPAAVAMAMRTRR